MVLAQHNDLPIQNIMQHLQKVKFFLSQLNTFEDKIKYENQAKIVNSIHIPLSCYCAPAIYLQDIGKRW